MTNFHQFNPDPDTLSNRIAASDTSPDTIVHQAGPVTQVAESPAPEAVRPTLRGLTALRDRVFVESTYRVILNREPDPPGLEYYLAQLRSGVLRKIDVIGGLRYSAEGRQRPMNVGGLAWGYALSRIRRLPGIGWVLRWLITAVRLPMILHAAEAQRAFVEEMSLAVEDLNATDGGAAREARLMSTRIQMLESALRESRGRTRVLSKRLDTTESGVREMRREVETHAARLAAAELAFEARYQRLSAAHGRLIQQLREMDTSAPAPRPVARTSDSASPAIDRSTVSDGFDSFYLDFEDRFRGSRDDTKRSHEVYLDYVTAAGAGLESAPILDLGCGRGEWLELLLESGFVARGVDLNRAMIQQNRERGLDVVEHDVMTYLAALPDASVGMLTGFHIIEHLPFDLLVRLFDECRRVLRPGGCVVFETPNPENLVVGAYTFYFDPTHRHPLPPQMVEFLAHHRGFADVEILRLHPRPEHGDDTAFLDRWFRAPVDYAVIGWRDGKLAR